MEALVDELDFVYYSQWFWSYSDKYAVRNDYPHGMIYLHVEIAKRAGIWIAGYQIDHRNQDKLDCQRTNLRPATLQQNRMNADQRIGESGYRGVSYNHNAKQWMAKITVNRHQMGLGYFICRHCAAERYNQAALRYHGEFAVLNIIEPHNHFTEE